MGRERERMKWEGVGTVAWFGGSLGEFQVQVRFATLGPRDVNSCAVRRACCECRAKKRENEVDGNKKDVRW